MAGGGDGLGDLTAKLRVDTSDLDRAEKHAHGFGSSIKSTFIGVGAAMGAAFAIHEITDFFQAGFAELGKLDALQAQTKAAIASTGGAAKITADQVTELADTMERKTGIDQKGIQAGENMLLTFTKVRNEVGNGNDIFSQATATATDMAVALGGPDGSVQDAAMKLGKALNDPIAGVTALRKVGVALTDAQKDQIEAMVKSGNIMGAQKVILQELQVEFGGSAVAFGETLPGQINKFHDSIEDAQVQVAGAFLPALKNILPIAANVATSVGRGLARAMDVAGAAFRSVQPIVERVFPQIQAIIGRAMDAIGKVVGKVIDGIVWAWDTFGAELASLLSTYLGALGTQFSGFQQTVGTIMDAIGALVTAIAPTIKTVMGDITRVVGAMQGAFAEVWKLLDKNLGPILKGTIVPLFKELAEFVGKVVTLGTDLLIAALKWLKDHINDAQPAIDIFKGVLEKLKDGVKLLVDNFDKIEPVIKIILIALALWKGAMIVHAAFTAIAAGASFVFGGGLMFVASGFAAAAIAAAPIILLIGLIAGAIYLLISNFDDVKRGVKIFSDTMLQVWEDVKTGAQLVVDHLGGVLTHVGNFFGNIVNSIQQAIGGAINIVIGFIRDLIQMYNDLPFTDDVDKPNLLTVEKRINNLTPLEQKAAILKRGTGDVRGGRFAVGGMTYGPQLAMVGDNPSGREHMIPEESIPRLANAIAGAMRGVLPRAAAPSGNSGVVVNVYGATNASPGDIGAEFAWRMKTA